MISKLGQCFFIGIQGTTLSDEEKKFIVTNNIGGVTLFSRNYENPDQLRELCKSLQSLRTQMPDKAPLYIAIDMEGGRVHRLKAPFTQWPSLRSLGELDSPSVSFHFALAMGQELKSVGINVNWAPCVDVLTNPQNTAIGDRSIGSDPELVAKHTSALVRGYLKAEVNPCIKHFPGHGNTKVDSHDELPTENATLDSLEKTEFTAFKKSMRARAEFIMTAHILFKNIDPDWPTTLSQKFLKDILRNQLRYRGLIVTDDLGMKALTKNYDKKLIPVRALQAGADLLLYCNEFDTPAIALEAVEAAIKSNQLSMTEIEKNHQRILAHKKENILHPEPLSKEAAAKVIGAANHFSLAQGILNKAVPASLLVGE